MSVNLIEYEVLSVNLNEYEVLSVHLIKSEVLWVHLINPIPVGVLENQDTLGVNLGKSHVWRPNMTNLLFLFYYVYKEKMLTIEIEDGCLKSLASIRLYIYFVFLFVCLFVTSNFVWDLTWPQGRFMEHKKKNNSGK